MVNKIYKSSPPQERMKKEGVSNDSGVVAVVFGILSIVFALSIFLGAIAGLILGIIGILFAWNQHKSAKNSWSKAGLILNLIGIFTNVVIVYFILEFLLTQIVPAIEQAALQAQQLESYQGVGGY